MILSFINLKKIRSMQLSPLTKRISFSFAKFAKYDYQDALNFKSLLNEE